MSKSKKLPNTIGIFGELSSIGKVVTSVIYDVDEYITARDSMCDDDGCKSCKYFGKNRTCCRPPLIIHFEPYEK